MSQESTSEVVYKMNETIGDYQAGEEYYSLPDEILNDHPGSFEILNDSNAFNYEPARHDPGFL